MFIIKIMKYYFYNAFMLCLSLQLSQAADELVTDVEVANPGEGDWNVGDSGVVIDPSVSDKETDTDVIYPGGGDWNVGDGGVVIDPSFPTYPDKETDTDVIYPGEGDWNVGDSGVVIDPSVSDKETDTDVIYPGEGDWNVGDSGVTINPSTPDKETDTDVIYPGGGDWNVGDGGVVIDPSFPTYPDKETDTDLINPGDGDWNVGDSGVVIDPSFPSVSDKETDTDLINPGDGDWNVGDSGVVIDPSFPDFEIPGENPNRQESAEAFVSSWTAGNQTMMGGMALDPQGNTYICESDKSFFGNCNELDIESKAPGDSTCALSALGSLSIDDIVLKQKTAVSDTVGEYKMFHAAGDIVLSDVSVSHAYNMIAETEGTMTIKDSLAVSLAAGMTPGDIALFRSAEGFVFEEGYTLTFNLAGDFAAGDSFVIFELADAAASVETYSLRLLTADATVTLESTEGFTTLPSYKVNDGNAKLVISEDGKQLMLVVIPEPTTATLSLLALAALAARRRRR